MTRSGRHAARLALALLFASTIAPAARADRLAWLDGVLRGVVRQTREELGAAARPIDEALVRSSSDLDTIAREADGWGRASLRSSDLSDETRFARLVGPDQDALRTFRQLSSSEKRLVTRLGEAARMVTRRHPERAEQMIRSLGPEGLSAVRAYGDDVAEVIVREGPDSINVLRKTGRPGWRFYTDVVLNHKAKLAAAGVLAAFLANPDQFIDSAGKITDFAVEQFARAGVDLAGAMGQGAARGLDRAMGGILARFGLDSSPIRLIATLGVGLIAVLSFMVLLGLPLRLLFRPFTWPIRALGRALRAGA